MNPGPRQSSPITRSFPVRRPARDRGLAGRRIRRCSLVRGIANRQLGFSLIQMVLAIGLMSYLSIQLIPYVSAWQEAKLIRVTRHGIEQLAQAAGAFRVDQNEHHLNPTVVWPADQEILIDRGYLPPPPSNGGVLCNGIYCNSVGKPYEFDTSQDWLVIRTDMLTNRQARGVAAEWGNFTAVNQVQVEVRIVVPGQESSHRELVQLDGIHAGVQQQMRGPLHWRPDLTGLDGSGDPIATTVAIDLGENDIDNVGRLRVQTAVNDGLLEADAANIQALTATDFSYDN